MRDDTKSGAKSKRTKGAKTGRPRSGKPPQPSDDARNDAGRPTLPDTVADVRTAARMYTADALRTLDEIMMSKSADSRARSAAAVALIDRGWGRPAQAVTGENGEGPIKMGLIVLPAERDDD